MKQNEAKSECINVDTKIKKNNDALRLRFQCARFRTFPLRQFCMFMFTSIINALKQLKKIVMRL